MTTLADHHLPGGGKPPLRFDLRASSAPLYLGLDGGSYLPGVPPESSLFHLTCDGEDVFYHERTPGASTVRKNGSSHVEPGGGVRRLEPGDGKRGESFARRLRPYRPWRVCATTPA